MKMLPRLKNVSKNNSERLSIERKHERGCMYGKI